VSTRNEWILLSSRIWDSNAEEDSGPTAKVRANQAPATYDRLRALTNPVLQAKILRTQILDLEKTCSPPSLTCFDRTEKPSASRI
jgi:hypothetical protein